MGRAQPPGFKGRLEVQWFLATAAAGHVRVAGTQCHWQIMLLRFRVSCCCVDVLRHRVEFEHGQEL